MSVRISRTSAMALPAKPNESVQHSADILAGVGKVLAVLRSKVSYVTGEEDLGFELTY